MTGLMIKLTVFQLSQMLTSKMHTSSMQKLTKTTSITKQSRNFPIDFRDSLNQFELSENLRLLSICHTIYTEEKNGEVVYNVITSLSLGFTYNDLFFA